MYYGYRCPCGCDARIGDTDLPEEEDEPAMTNTHHISRSRIGPADTVCKPAQRPASDFDHWEISGTFLDEIEDHAEEYSREPEGEDWTRGVNWPAIVVSAVTLGVIGFCFGLAIRLALKLWA